MPIANVGKVRWAQWHRWRDIDEYRIKYGRIGSPYSRKPSDFFSLSSPAGPGLGNDITLADTLPDEGLEEEAVTRMDLTAMINGFPVRTRGILIASAQGYTAVEIAGWCDITPSRVGQILKDARWWMRTAIFQEVPLSVPKAVGV